MPEIVWPGSITFLGKTTEKQSQLVAISETLIVVKNEVQLFALAPWNGSEVQFNYRV
jgi:hypothetical protein